MDGNTVDAQKIREVEFRERMRGYHQEDVDEFLEQVAKGVEVLEDQLQHTREELARLKANPPAAVAKSADLEDDVIQRTLIVAQRAADQLRDDAEREAREIRAEAQRQAERILGEARTTSRLIEEERRKHLLEELAQLESEFSRRQEQLASILKRDRAVRQKISDEIGGLLALVRAADVPETVADGSADVDPRFSGSTPVDPSHAGEVRLDESHVSDPPELSSQLADGSEGSETMAFPAIDSDSSDEAQTDDGQHRPVQEFVFGHDISVESGDDEPFMLWRQDD